MQDKKRKQLLLRLEYVSLSILVPIIYLSVVRLIFGKEYNLPWRIISNELALTIILGFDIIWVISMIAFPFKNKHIKILITLLVLTISAIILTDLFLIYKWHGMW